jgi:hypothetical protein
MRSLTIMFFLIHLTHLDELQSLISVYTGLSSVTIMETTSGSLSLDNLYCTWLHLMIIAAAAISILGKEHT